MMYVLTIPAVIILILMMYSFFADMIWEEKNVRAYKAAFRKQSSKKPDSMREL